ncbi:hypothetical protein [Streptomyces sp. NPDC006334]|uniref:hypothetical protein n=1 Tax=Streptomyces sp. NPDC006334 TaxID=3156754 RepID=UPI0033A08BE9
MSSLLRVQGRIGQRTLLLTTATVPLTGWAVHAVTGRAHFATATHATVPSINGRRAGRPGTAVWGRAA